MKSREADLEMEKVGLLPRPYGHRTRKSKIRSTWKSVIPATVLAAVLFTSWQGAHPAPKSTLTEAQLSDGLRQCAKNQQHPFVDYSLASSRLSRRDAKDPVKIFRNATLINGDGSIHHEIDVEVQGDIITYVGKQRLATPAGADIFDVGGRYLSPGLIDMHSHVGVRQEPQILMNADVTESTQPVTPWARAIDGFKPSDQGIKIVASGGITTSLVLTGASNLISGEGMVIKHRDTNSVWKMELDSTNSELQWALWNFRDSRLASFPVALNYCKHMMYLAALWGEIEAALHPVTERDIENQLSKYQKREIIFAQYAVQVSFSSFRNFRSGHWLR